MKGKIIVMRQPMRRILPLGFSLVLLSILAAAGLTKSGQASSTTTTVSGSQTVTPFAADTCATATVINPAALPFSEEGTLALAANDIDPGPAGCAPGPGSDVVYSFTPAATDTYTIGATPTNPYDLSLYIVTDCSNPVGTCVAGTNARGFDRGEVLTPVLSAGVRYFIDVDTATLDPNAAGFHFSVRRGLVANETCATATVIDPSRLPFTGSGTTFGAANNLDPGSACFTSPQATRGGDVVFQFTSPDTQLYVITVTPNGRFDASVYLTTNCATIDDCFSADVGGAGAPKILRKTLNAGTTYFVVVDSFLNDSGDFAISLVPSTPRAPVAPSDLTATAVSPTQINLSWHDNSGDEQGFRIERSLDGFNFSELATVASNVTTFSDTNAAPNTFFFYRVSAFNGFGTSEPSNIAFAQTPGNPIPVTPQIVVAPVSIDFGSVRATQSDTRMITVTSGGAASLIITAITDPASPFSIVGKPALPLTLTTNQSVTFSVKFSPAFIGRANGSFTILSNDPLAPVVTVTLTGIGASAPVANLEITPPAVDFGTGTTPVMVDLKNTGEADLLISSILPPTAPFGISGGGTGTVKSGQKLTLTITFSPSSIGVFQSGLTVVSNDPDSLLTFVSIRGVSTSQVLVPRVVGLEFRKRGLRFQAAGSNVVTGATLIVDGRETFTLELAGDFWVVGKAARSTPGNQRVRDIFLSPSTHTVVVKNPNGGQSAPVTLIV